MNLRAGERSGDNYSLNPVARDHVDPPFCRSGQKNSFLYAGRVCLRRTI